MVEPPIRDGRDQLLDADDLSCLRVDDCRSVLAGILVPTVGELPPGPVVVVPLLGMSYALGIALAQRPELRCNLVEIPVDPIPEPIEPPSEAGRSEPVEVFAGGADTHSERAGEDAGRVTLHRIEPSIGQEPALSEPPMTESV
jgi:hypothetical protein